MISRRKSTAALASIALAAIFSVASPAQAQDAPKVKLATSMGDIVVQLDPAKAPKTVENFLAYVKDKHYDGTVFHRVIDGFMIQGGGFTADMVQKPTKAPIPLEAANGLKNDTYTIAMARTGNPNSATAQFFINVKDNAMLNAPQPDGHGYAVFGKVVSGTEVVDKIKAVPTSNKGPHQNVPTTPVTINSATLVK
ncbi:peptidyl-prolyl cis-trans isomerase cyclophilin type [Acidovorax delafieldii 2AN]|uniref:Peptidyl-prolyl cis-trans isomerase n=1 Tax=Acidovorax delafieldii 2AN TaxID=573060 RepID=C5T3E1_ACIDE|nr:peptidylprolyl isomerase [Acidovorax delafieldii]EER60992.1 peptidyl-prolyl cis-trans isomerase cyclophilin type [Acidovorax delafieldii 2AN]